MTNQVQEKVLAALRSVAKKWELDWVEVRTGPAEGVVRLQPPGRFRTLLKLEYEFEPHACRLLAYRDGRRVAGRCGINYDDGEAIEEVLGHVRALFNRPGVAAGAAAAAAATAASRAVWRDAGSAASPPPPPPPRYREAI